MAVYYAPEVASKLIDKILDNPRADKHTVRRIQTAHPLIRLELASIYWDILAANLSPRFAWVLRDAAVQAELYAKYKAGGPKAAAPGLSFHGYGLAVDFCLLVEGKSVSWDTKADFNKDKISDWMQIVGIFKSYGWTWGGDWKSPDRPHLEKNFGLKASALLSMAKAGKLDRNGYLILEGKPFAAQVEKNKTLEIRLRERLGLSIPPAPPATLIPEKNKPEPKLELEPPAGLVESQPQTIETPSEVQDPALAVPSPDAVRAQVVETVPAAAAIVADKVIDKDSGAVITFCTCHICRDKVDLNGPGSTANIFQTKLTKVLNTVYPMTQRIFREASNIHDLDYHIGPLDDSKSWQDWRAVYDRKLLDNCRAAARASGKNFLVKKWLEYQAQKYYLAVVLGGAAVFPRLRCDHPDRLEHRPNHKPE
jgi:peptidoglycan L-alanyl-D-glutamate endopeptidase CwlK